MRPLETTAEEFEWQMRILSRHFNVLRLVDAVDMLRTASLPRGRPASPSMTVTQTMPQ